jgi:hypothetical protein
MGIICLRGDCVKYSVTYAVTIDVDANSLEEAVSAANFVLYTQLTPSEFLTYYLASVEDAKGNCIYES